MGDIKRKIQRLEDDAEIEYIEQKDGSYYWYSPRELYKAFTLYYLNTLGSDYRGEPRPPAPQVFHAVANAKDREQAMTQILSNWRENQNHCGVDLRALVEEGEVRPFNWVNLIMAHEEAKDD